MGLPDNASAPLLDAIRRDGRIAHVAVSREGEAFAVAAGLWVGGKVPVVVVQNTGLLESGDGLRGTATRMGVPLLVVVTMRGAATLEAAGVAATALPRPREVLVREDVDSAALFTEATLDAWGIPFYRFEPAAAAGVVRAAWERARGEERPVALLMAGTPAAP